MDQNKINKQICLHDDLREELARKGLLDSFIRTYTERYEIKNANTRSHWDSIFALSGGIEQQSPMTKDKIRWIVGEIQKNESSILDIGIGDAFVEELLKKRGTKFNLSGIDISRTALEKAKKKYKGKFIRSNALRLESKFKGKKFDVILAIELLEHISVSKLFSLYKQVNSLLKTDGKFILSIPINERLDLKDDNPSAHVRDYTYNIIRSELKLNGFRVEKVNYLYAFEKQYFFKKWLSKIFVNRWKPNSLTIVAKKTPKKLKNKYSRMKR